MGISYDYFVSADGTPVDEILETKWVEPTVRIGRLYAQLTEQVWSATLRVTTRVGPEPLERLSDPVRDALADVADGRVAQVGAWWAGTEEFVLDRVPVGEVTALLEALVGLSRTARVRGHGLYVLTRF